jgi:hypothetical protein
MMRGKARAVDDERKDIVGKRLDRQRDKSTPMTCVGKVAPPCRYGEMMCACILEPPLE